MLMNVPSVPSRGADRESSRLAILDAVRSPEPFTLVRGAGNLGDQLIAAGARQLFAGLPYGEMSIEEACRGRGPLAVLMGSGAWCAPYHELMPPALSVLASRYERVVVLPSSFDVSVPAVRRALSRSRAVVFARERESFAQIGSLCDARLAHDTAFFFDYAPYAMAGSGVLRAFRRDAEATGRAPVSSDNRDISMELGSLDEWLWTIARHEEVHTDRAHVMIAAAMMGKRVEAHPSTTAKVPAIASYALAGFPVHVAPVARPPLAAAPQAISNHLRQRLFELGSASLRHIPDAEVTIIVVSHNRLERTKACIASIAENVRMPYRLRVIDNASEPHVREELARICEVRQLETNVGCTAARQLGAESSDTEYLAFVDDDTEVFPGAIENLVHALEEGALVSGARIVLPNGLLQFCGGEYQVRDGVVRFEPLERGRPFDAPLAAQRCHWLGATAFACRRALFHEFPLDLGMTTYFEDNEWCYRVDQAHPAAFRTAPDAFVLHHQQTKERRGSAPEELQRAADFLVPLARFYARHGLVLEDVFGFIPELNLPDGTRDVAAARLLLELVTAKGRDWLALQWVTGGLTPLFLRRPLAEITSSRAYRFARLYWRFRR
ncbi:MAG TPA: glycosyltransferase [Thermoanaerobaculia bacterium]|jgi:GT2 family glycosyltransferase|nr:glycosyltransferase [Thermoanaerobaculia bacterium]